MVCENCRVRPASVQVFGQRGGQRSAVYLCTQCARELGMIGAQPGGGNPFEMLNLIQQQNQGPGNFFEALTEEAREAVMRAREASAGTTRTAAIGTDHLLAGIVTGENVATDALRREIARLLQQRGARMGPGGGGLGGGFSGGGFPGGPGGPQGPESQTPVLDQVSRDLTEMARNGELDPVVGRAEEISRVIRILSRRTKNNPVLVGEAGVGKTAIAEGLAQRI